MKFVQKSGAQKVCPKTGKVIEPKRRYRAVRWLLPLTGLGALVWFLIRVIPKPSRATYPCQRVAFPLASSFIIWLMGLAGSAAAYRKARTYITRTKYVLAILCVVVSVGFIWLAASATWQKGAAAAPRVPQPANAPMGTAKGIHPGRVAWIHDANATDWDYTTEGQSEHWYQSNHTDQNSVTDMMSKAIRTLAGTATDARAWDVIFKYFNREHGRGAIGYTPGEKIAIKVNFTLTYGADPCTMDKPSSPYWGDWYNWVDNSPQLSIALLDQLVNVAGVSQSDITIGDPSRIMPNYWYNIVHPVFPDVVYLTRAGYTGCGRTIETWDVNAPFYWSDPDPSHFAQVTEQDHIPTHFSQADYLINFAVLKSHSDSGVTLCAKNNYGSLLRNPSAWEMPDPNVWYDMHSSRLLAGEAPGMGHYRALVDLMGHPNLGGKTLLYMIDGLFAGEWWNAVPVKWNMPPFNGDWPSSILVSEDPVAIDSVAFDFLLTEWPKDGNEAAGAGAGPYTDGADDYLHEAALANDPCSGTFYDPDNDGIALQSLGTHEHWNNSTDKQYTRNLGTGDGIELVTAPRTISQLGDFDDDGDVDLADFAILAAAWHSSTDGNNWNQACDISDEQDGVIDELDLMVFCINWLEGVSDALIEPGAGLQEVYSASKFFEGPTWDANSGKLYFTNRTDKQVLRLDSPGSATVWMNGAPGTNGTFLALDGRLLTADEDTQQIRSHRIGTAGPEDSQVLAGPADGVDKKPNDLCQLQNGNIYFTCPDWAAGPTEQGVYLLKTNGSVTRVASGLYQPNGIIASNDGTKLYVSESSSSDINKKRWWVYPINPDGTLGTGSVFFKPASPPGTNDPDGMTIDIRGNLYFCGLGGLWIVSPAGEQLAMVEVPQACSNVTFGGPANKTLYITCQDKVYSLAMRVAGGGWGGSQIPTEPTIAATDAAITVDGTVESAWNSARVYKLDNILLGSVSDDNDLSGTWRAIWDYNNLYFLVEITDDVQYNDSVDPWQDDAVELYVDADHSQGASYDGTNDYELIFRWNDPGVVHLGVYSATNTTGMDFVIVDTATGYRFEAALPWSAMGVTPVGGNYIGLDVHTCDDDNGGDREAKKAWWAQTDDSWQWPNIFASVRLTGTSVPPVPPGQAANPSPTGTGVDINSDLSWTAGTNATSHDVYFGTDSTPDVGELQGNQPGVTFEPGTLDYDTTYYWRIDEKNAVGTTTGIVWSFTTASAPGPLPSPWISYDIDSPGAAGSASYSSGVFTVSGSGADIAGTSDAGQFVYQPISGDGTIIARVVSLTNVVADWAKAGIMFRESLDADSTFAYGNYTTNVSRSVNSWTLLHRDTTGGGATQTVWGSATPPYWLKVVRSGNSFTGYVSSNGSSWSVIDTVNIPMSSNVYVGMAVTSHKAGEISTATFDNVSVTP